nr:MAG: glycoprotein [Beetle aliusvirus]
MFLFAIESAKCSTDDGKHTLSEVASILEPVDTVYFTVDRWMVHLPLWLPCPQSYYSDDIRNHYLLILKFVNDTTINYKEDLNNYIDQFHISDKFSQNMKYIFSVHLSSLKMLAESLIATMQEYDSISGRNKDIIRRIDFKDCGQLESLNLQFNTIKSTEYALRNTRLKRSVSNFYQTRGSHNYINYEADNNPSPSRNNHPYRLNLHDRDYECAPEYLSSHHTTSSTTNSPILSPKLNSHVNESPKRPFISPVSVLNDQDTSRSTIPYSTLDYSDQIVRKSKTLLKLIQSTTKDNYLIYACQEDRVPSRDSCYSLDMKSNEFMNLDQIVPTRHLSDPIYEDTPGRLIRSKRALLSFVGDLYSSLFGVATEKDIEGIKEAIKLSIKARETTAQAIVKLNDQMNLISTGIDNKIEMIVNQTNSIFSNLSDSLVNLDSSILKLSENVSMNSVHIDILQWFEIHDAFISQTTIKIQQINIKLNVLRQHLNAITYILDSQSLSSLLIPQQVLTVLLDKINSNLPRQLMISPLLSVAQLYKPDMITVTRDNNRLFLSFYVPIVPRITQMSMWRIGTLPFVRGEGWAKLDILEQYFIVDIIKNRWSWISSDRYHLCLSTPSGICYQDHPWTSSDHAPCVIDYIFSKVFDSSKCTLHIENNISPSAFFSAQLSRCSWLISSDNNINKLVSECLSPDLNKVVKHSTLPSVAILSINNGCEIAIAGHYFVCHPSLREKLNIPAITNLESTIAFENTMRDLSILESLDTQLPRLSLRQVSLNVTAAKQEFNVHVQDTIKIRDLINQSGFNANTYISSMDAINQKINDIITTPVEESSSILSWFKFDSPKYISWLALILSLTAILMLCLPKLSRRLSPLGMVASAVPLAMEKLPGSFALDVNKTEFNKSTLLLNISHANSTSSEWHDHITQIPVGLGTMIILHSLSLLVMLYVHYRCNEKIIRQLGITPRNRMSLHHPGEVSLNISLLVKFNRIFGLSSFVREIVIQVCTLPRSFDEWYCVEQLGYPESIQIHITPRYYRTFTFKLNWGRLCIRSALDDNVDTCQELPKKVSVALDDVTRQCDLQDVWMWVSCEPVSITTLYLSGPSYYKCIYSYDNLVMSRKGAITSPNSFSD